MGKIYFLPMMQSGDFSGLHSKQYHELRLHKLHLVNGASVTEPQSSRKCHPWAACVLCNQATSGNLQSSNLQQTHTSHLCSSASEERGKKEKISLSPLPWQHADTSRDFFPSTRLLKRTQASQYIRLDYPRQHFLPPDRGDSSHCCSDCKNRTIFWKKRF